MRLEGNDAGYPSPFAHYPRMRGTVMKMVFDSLLEQGSSHRIFTNPCCCHTKDLIAAAFEHTHIHTHVHSHDHEHEHSHSQL